MALTQQVVACLYLPATRVSCLKCCKMFVQSKYCYLVFQLGMVAHLCNLATGELVLWIVGGRGSLGEAGYVEPASALSLASTWAPCGSTW